MPNKRRTSKRRQDRQGAILIFAILALVTVAVVWTTGEDPRNFPGIERLRG